MGLGYSFIESKYGTKCAKWKRASMYKLSKLFKIQESWKNLGH
jgi:hypothetical protein